MASTYSPSLKLELMATGDQSGTWGVTNNTNLGTLLEQAITGVLSVAQGDVANLTLTSLDGASDQARNAVINLTGAMTAGRNVVVPTANKVYLVKNSTTGGFAVTVKTAAGTGVAIAAGTAQWVYCDGTNVVQGLSGTLASQAAASVAITGGTITGLTSLTLASGAATPATNDAAALGSATLSWSDLFLASGAVVNIANGNWVATHTSGILTVGTGDLRVTTAGTNAASVVTVGGTQTLSNKTFVAPALGTPASGVATNLTGTAASLTAGTASVANSLKSATTNVDVSAATAPSSGQVLTATSSTTATWQTAASGSMTLLGTLTTTSGSTQSLTSIAAGYRQIYCEVDGVSGSLAAATLSVATSSTNGAAYGGAVTISAGLSGSSATLNGAVTVYNVSSTIAAAKAAQALIGESVAAAYVGTAATNTAAVVDAIRFGISAGSFDAGSIRIYGVK